MAFQFGLNCVGLNDSQFRALKYVFSSRVADTGSTGYRENSCWTEHTEDIIENTRIKCEMIKIRILS